jgi:predicted transcriptional regulator
MKKRQSPQTFPSLAAYLEHLGTLGQTQAEFAESFGISVGHLSELKNGKVSPSLALLKRFRDECGIPVEAFFTETHS